MSTQRTISSGRVTAPITRALLALIDGSCKIAEGVVGSPAAVVGAATGSSSA